MQELVFLFTGLRILWTILVAISHVDGVEDGVVYSAKRFVKPDELVLAGTYTRYGIFKAWN